MAVPCLPWPCHACHGRAAPAYTPPCLLWAQTEDSLPDDLLAAMDAAAELQSDAEQPDSDAEQLDVAALRQSLVDLTRLGSSEQQGPGAKADAQRWKEVFGSDTAWSKCPRPPQPTWPPPRRAEGPPAGSALPGPWGSALAALAPSRGCGGAKRLPKVADVSTLGL